MPKASFTSIAAPRGPASGVNRRGRASEQETKLRYQILVNPVLIQLKAPGRTQLCECTKSLHT